MTVSVVTLVHGYEPNGPGHWQTWLADRLPAAGVRVRYPRLPDPYAPDLAAWVAALEVVLASDDPAGRIVVAHSLGCHLWGHVAASATELLADRVVLVSPPGRTETRENFAGLPPAALDAESLGRASVRTDLVLGEGDPWRSDPRDYRGDAVPVWLVAGGGHLNVDAGLGPWPVLLEWLLDRGPAPGVAG